VGSVFCNDATGQPVQQVVDGVVLVRPASSRLVALVRSLAQLSRDEQALNLLHTQGLRGFRPVRATDVGPGQSGLSFSASGELVVG
jgi:hypothetical protein